MICFVLSPVQCRWNNNREVCFWMMASANCRPILKGGIRFYNIEGENTGRYIGMKGECLRNRLRSHSRCGDVRETSGRVHRSNRALRYFPPAVGGIRLNPVGSAVRLVHWLLDKLLGPDSAAIPRIPARWFMALNHGLVPARTCSDRPSRV